MSEQVQNQTMLKPVTNPSDSELWAWWQTIQQDPAGRQWFSDAFPKTYADFVGVLLSGAERCVVFLDGDQVAGGYWLHDMVDDDPDYPPYAWIRGYVDPAYRGRFMAQAWPVACSIFEQWGYRHLFAATHVNNQRTLACLDKTLKFTRVGDYPNFCFFDGKPSTCTVYSMYAEDVSLAMRDAKFRSEHLCAA
ncbi:MAG: hypothetical protein ETSY1_30005 [Candidatus Entotheonella factor]|uniref:N-acetyltransferase domain-containing protein n=1 Tax=Entotheonella factor TaxID=1429438 RepID=W4LCW8_ENTF1|nr:GNAT family protein [Candidatus Entotheonella palauensis]ETW95570.1 MAG: hypothetical protein ETSY1_30005 [Candidatus Entotheonella factor]